MQCEDLIAVIRSKHRLNELCASDLFGEIISIQPETVVDTGAEFFRSIDHFDEFLLFSGI